jgi:hypothetical protein
LFLLKESLDKTTFSTFQSLRTALTQKLHLGRESLKIPPQYHLLKRGRGAAHEVVFLDD